MVFEERDFVPSPQSTQIRPLINFLKLPLAHRWVCYEWFYSDIDRAIFGTENEFKTSVRLCFPELKTFQLKKAQWRGIRRALDKPRRHSPAFFKDALKDLNDKRARVRLLQRKRAPINGIPRDSAGSDFRTHLDIPMEDLPTEIPSSTVVGTGVIVRMRRPLDGLYEGVINAVDVSRNSFRVLLDSQGAHVVSDCDVTSKHPPRMISVTRRGRTDSKLSCRRTVGIRAVSTELLLQMARLNTLIRMKEELIGSLRLLNYESELSRVGGASLGRGMVVRHFVYRRKLEQINGYIGQIVCKLRERGTEGCLEKMMSVVSMARDCGEDVSRLRNELDLLRDQLDPANYGLFSRYVEQHFLPLFR